MRVQQSLNKLDFYKRKMAFGNLIFGLGIPKRISDKLEGWCTYRNRHIFKGIRLLFILILSSTFWLFLITKDYLKPYMFINFIIYCIVASYLMNQQSLRYTMPTLKDNHYYKVLGEKRYLLIRHTLISRINNHFILWIIPPMILPIIYYSIKHGVIVFFLLVVILLFTYYLMIILTVISNYISTTFKHQVLLETIVVLTLNSFYAMVLLVMAFIGLLIFHLLGFPIVEFKSGELDTLPLVIYLSLMCVGLKVIITKWVEPFIRLQFVKKVHIKAYEISERKQKAIKPVKKKRIMLSFNTSPVQQVIIDKDFKMVFRGYKKQFVTYMISSVFSIPLGIGYLNTVRTNSANYQATLTMGFILTGIIGFITLFNFYQMKYVTWISSEGFNLRIYTMTKINYSDLFKSKRKVNFRMALPAILGFSLSSVWLLLFASWIHMLIWLGFILYLTQLITIVIDFVLWTDMTKPPLKPEYKLYWIGDSLNMMMIGTVMVFVIPFTLTMIMAIFPPHDGVLIGVIGFVAATITYIRLNTNKNMKKLKRAKIVSCGGVTYDSL